MESFGGKGMTRRQFGRLLGAAGALALVETNVLARAFGNDRSVSALAYRTASAEGAWRLTEVEGRVPKNLAGTLVRVCPGRRENNGVVYKHLFDGDAYLASYSFRDGAVALRARFVDTPERRRELEAGRMLYSEFGTLAPPLPPGTKVEGGKNQPSVNVVHWDGRLLGLSEGGHPTAVAFDDLSYQGRWDFHGTLPPNVPFTAHPKFDRAAGVGYGYGIMRGPSMALQVYRMEADGKLTLLHAIPLGGYYIVHDMLMSAEHLVFVVPPVKMDLQTLFAGKSAPADALRYLEKEPTRVIVVRRDGTGKPVTFELPASMVFHHGNAFEREGKLVFDTILSPDASVLTSLAHWDTKDAPPSTPARLTRLVLDLEKRSVESRTELDSDLEFPRFDERVAGRDARFLYTLGGSDDVDYSFVFTSLTKHDLRSGKQSRVQAGKLRAVGEPVFVPHPGRTEEDRGWILLQGFDAGRDRNYLEIRDAGTLDLEARIWTPVHFPLGFHGNFVQGA